MMRSEVRAEGGRAWAGGSARAACAARGPGCEGWGAIGHVRGAHVEHVANICDAGGVEAQRLVERPRALPRVERRAYRAG